jgi:hypothetical protein
MAVAFHWVSTCRTIQVIRCSSNPASVSRTLEIHGRESQYRNHFIALVSERVVVSDEEHPSDAGPSLFLEQIAENGRHGEHVAWSNRPEGFPLVTGAEALLERFLEGDSGQASFGELPSGSVACGLIEIMNVGGAMHPPIGVPLAYDSSVHSGFGLPIAVTNFWTLDRSTSPATYELPNGLPIRALVSSVITDSPIVTIPPDVVFAEFPGIIGC